MRSDGRYPRSPGDTGPGLIDEPGSPEAGSGVSHCVPASGEATTDDGAPLTDDRGSDEVPVSLEALARAFVGKAFEDATIGMAVNDSEGRIVLANRALERFLGYGPEGLVGLHFADFTHPGDVAENAELVREVAEGVVDRGQREKRYLRSDGEMVWGLLHLSRIDDPGEPTLRFAQVVDIDDRKRAEDKVAFHASLLDEVHNAVAATDLKGFVIYWNRHAERLFGWTADEMIGASLLERVIPEDPAATQERVTEALATEGEWTGEGVLRRRDGSDVPALMSAAFIHDSEGETEGVVGVMVDLSQIKEAERAIQRQDDLAHSVLRSVRFPVAVLDGQGRITAVNREWVRTAVENGGSAAATGVGVDYLEVCRQAGDDFYALAAAAGIEDVLWGRLDTFALEYPSGAGGERHFEMEVTPLANSGAVVIHWDMTEEWLARKALEETIRAKDRFIASLSHELRTPLTAVMGLAEELRGGSYSPQEMDEFHRVIAEQSQEVSLMVEDLLVAARLDSGTLFLKPANVLLRPELEKVVAPWTSHQSLDITIEGDPGTRAWADPGRMRQILRNLVVNAIKHGAEPLGVTFMTVGDVTQVRVLDHGPGIPETGLGRMFEPYAVFTTGDARPSSVGLGLPVSRSLAEQMGGSLSYSRDGERTVFTLTLPAHHQTDTSG